MSLHDPATEYIALQKEAREKIQQHQKSPISGFDTWVSESVKKEDKLRRDIKLNSKREKRLWDKKFDLESEVNSLKNSLYFLR